MSERPGFPRKNHEHRTIRLVLALLLSLGTVSADLLVVTLQSSQVLARLGELTLLHTLTDVPVHERALRVHQVELVVETVPRGADSGRVRQHAQAAARLGKVATRDHRARLIADTELEAGRAPVDELDRTLRLDARDGSRRVLGHDITTVKQADGHVLALAGVALDHLVTRLEAGEGHLRDRVLLVASLVRRKERCVGGEREVNARETEDHG